jgi:copper chaperone CopZ
MLFVSCARESRIITLDLEIDELICTDGQHILEGSILSLEGIKTVTANIQTQKVQIRFRENQISAEQISNQLLESGFTVDGVKGKAAARKRLPACCFK